MAEKKTESGANEAAVPNGPAAPANDPAAVANAPVVVAVTPAQQQRAQRAVSRTAAQAERTERQHEVEGGRYLVGDQFVDANGEPVKEKRAEKDED